MSYANVVALVLAGGAGSRLHPLTKDRAKPAVPFGGKYRIIDFTLSNCLHSGLRRILVLTQYKSHSLQTHLRDGWSIFNPSIGEYITPVPPQQRTGESWYSGTADAVYQNLFLLERSGADRVLILSGDHIYRMDYAAMIEFCARKNADAAVACMQVPRRSAQAFGVMAVDDDQRVVDFAEKPDDPRPIPSDPDQSLASMGVYVFDRRLLCQALREDHRNTDSAHDFGRDIIPKMVSSHEVYAYTFGSDSGRVSVDRYWRDVGTVDAYYEANMDLLKTHPPLDLYQTDWTIRSSDTQAPPARAVPGPCGRRAEVENVILAGGTVVAGASVWNSVLSRNVMLHTRSSVKHSILLDHVTVGEGAKLKNCIVDKHVRIPPGEVIGYDVERDRCRFTVSEGGVVVVPRKYRFRDRVSDPTDETVASMDDTATLSPDVVDSKSNKA